MYFGKILIPFYVTGGCPSLDQVLIGPMWNSLGKLMDRDTRRWILGLVYIFVIAAIWIAASYIVQSVVDAGVSPFLVTYICNSLFMAYIPLVEIARCFNDSNRRIWSWWETESNADVRRADNLENVHLIPEVHRNSRINVLLSHNGDSNLTGSTLDQYAPSVTTEELSGQVDERGRWTRTRVAKVSLLICPFWFFAQLAFNLSLKYTTVTVSICLIFFMLIHEQSMYNMIHDGCFITSCSLIPS